MTDESGATDEQWMQAAITEARLAEAKGEVPVGAVIIHEGQVIGRGHNERELSQDPTTHAEMIAIREAAKAVGSWRLIDTTLYVTLEPCPMCAGALVNSRVERLVFAARDPKAGYCGSLGNLVQDARLNHHVEIVEGVLAEESGALLRRFFASLRRNR